MSSKIFPIIKKNLNLLFNARFSSLIFILGPIILIMVVGFALNDTSIKNISSGVYAEDLDFSESFSSKLEERGFIIYEEPSLESCKNNVINSVNNVCIHFKKDFSEDSLNSLNLGSGNHLELYVDFSQHRIVWNIIGSIKGVAELESERIRKNSIEDLKIFSNEIISEIGTQKKNIDFLLSELERIDETLDILEEDSRNVDNLISTSQVNLNSILSFLMLIENSNTPFSSDASIYINDLNEVKNNLDLVSSLSYSGRLNSIKNNLRTFKKNLLDLDSSLNSLESDLIEMRDSDLDNLANPIVVSYTSVVYAQGGEVSEDLEFFDYLFPNFLMFFILFSSIFYGTISVMRERKSSSYIRNMASGIRSFDFIFSNFLTSVGVVFIQIVILLLISHFFVNISLLSNPLGLIIFLILSISFFSLVGFFIGFLFNSYESSIIASVSASLLFFMFSSLVAPVETLPNVLSKIVSMTPFSLLETKARLILIFGSKLIFSPLQIISLTSFVFVLIIFTYVFYRKNKEKEI